MSEPPIERPDPGQWTPPPAPTPPPPPPPGTFPSPGQSPAVPQEPTVFTPQPPPPARKHRAPLIASLVAVIAIVGGGAITYVALSDSSDSGAASPREAVQNAVQDLENSDFVGLLDDLAPGERDALANPIRDDVDQLKNLHVLDPSADPSKVAGVTFRGQNLSYGAKTIIVNDHVQIVELTGGTVDITGDSSKVPFSDQFRSTAHLRNSTSTEHVNIAADDPVRIATVEVAGRWYPSIFYTAADSAAGHQLPTAGDAIPAVGSASAEDAVRDEVNALLGGDLRTALAHISPSELGAVHDYGGMLLDQLPRWSNTAVKITGLELTTSALPAGATRVSLKTLSVTHDGITVKISIDGTCATLSGDGNTKKFCASDAADAVKGFLSLGVACNGGGSTSNGRGWTSYDQSGAYPETCSMPKLTEAQTTALTDLFTGFTKLGIATTQTDGRWFVNPVRSVIDVYGTLLEGLKGNDIFALAQLGN